jgi:hypothetical protein
MGDTTYCAVQGLAAQHFALLSTTSDFINGLIALGHHPTVEEVQPGALVEG